MRGTCNSAGPPRTKVRGPCRPRNARSSRWQLIQCMSVRHGGLSCGPPGTSLASSKASLPTSPERRMTGSIRKRSDVMSCPGNRCLKGRCSRRQRRDCVDPQRPRAAVLLGCIQPVWWSCGRCEPAGISEWCDISESACTAAAPPGANRVAWRATRRTLPFCSDGEFRAQQRGRYTRGRPPARSMSVISEPVTSVQPPGEAGSP